MEIRAEVRVYIGRETKQMTAYAISKYLYKVGYGFELRGNIAHFATKDAARTYLNNLPIDEDATEIGTFDTKEVDRVVGYGVPYMTTFYVEGHDYMAINFDEDIIGYKINEITILD